MAEVKNSRNAEAICVRATPIPWANTHFLSNLVKGIRPKPTVGLISGVHGESQVPGHGISCLRITSHLNLNDVDEPMRFISSNKGHLRTMHVWYKIAWIKFFQTVGFAGLRQHFCGHHAVLTWPLVTMLCGGMSNLRLRNITWHLVMKWNNAFRKHLAP